ncbi:MAG TPA: hypothetical protein VGS21_00560, partial [Acidimicrobiales bacterium]|nr:hypothetical protein [Acidimicrobiales bacterium]
AVKVAMGRLPDHVTVTTAAHGLAGSSPAAFCRVASYLAMLLGVDVVTALDSELWEMWDISRSDSTS